MSDHQHHKIPADPVVVFSAGAKLVNVHAICRTNNMPHAWYQCTCGAIGVDCRAARRTVWLEPSMVPE